LRRQKSWQLAVGKKRRAQGAGRRAQGKKLDFRRTPLLGGAGGGLKRVQKMWKKFKNCSWQLARSSGLRAQSAGQKWSGNFKLAVGISQLANRHKRTPCNSVKNSVKLRG
jgi:hypothetical protein